MVVPDYNLMTPAVIEQVLKRPIEKALGKAEIERINRIQANYDYYHGMQDLDDFGRYIYATDKDDWDGKDYKPTRVWTNYYKAFIKRKSRWQMAGTHGINVVPDSDSLEDIEKAQALEKILYQLWEHNGMESNKMQIARERLIAGSIACKMVFNQRTGRLHWIWHKATEVFPIYSKDGFNELVGCDIVIAQEDDDDPDKTQYVRQSFRLDTDSDYACWYDEVVFDEELHVKRTITPKTYLGFDFIPVVIFDIQTLATEAAYFEDVEDMKVITRTINSMMEDASDSLRFEMFAMTAIKNADLSQSEELKIQPGGVLVLQSGQSSHPADVETVETTFQWKESFKDQYNRLKSALHELAGIPMISPTELNFGGMNDRALQVLYQEIIQETQEHWLSWDKAFKELFQKSVWYLQARDKSPKFRYDKEVLSQVDEFNSEMNFVLPLPDDRQDLVELVLTEIEGGLESRKNGMQRLGVKSPEDKLAEILAEAQEAQAASDPYGEQSTYDDVVGSVLEPVEKELATE